MTRKSRARIWLCQGCNFAPKTGVVDGKIDCGAAGKKVDAVPHKKYCRFESCPYRQNVKTNFLQELAKRCREAREKAGGELSSERVARIEKALRKERGM